MQRRSEVGSLQSNRDFSLLRLLCNRTNRTGISLFFAFSAIEQNQTTLLGSFSLPLFVFSTIEQTEQGSLSSSSSSMQSNHCPCPKANPLLRLLCNQTPVLKRTQLLMSSSSSLSCTAAATPSSGVVSNSRP
uniref:Uncharacterized protein n=1 Tax=Nelumbo nucifera TaxID=4432 RepID=A0A822XEQ2_NELNU|nr:TPA_asm: hypothetical protein HUJ06_019586 [Nelumbo nucifera]